MRWKLVALIILAFGAYHFLSGKTITHSPGELVSDDPAQEKVQTSTDSFEKNGYKITPLAEFSVRARVLSAEHYRFGREADLSPVDLALGWGPMSDTSVLDKLDISQGGRFYHYRWGSEGPPIPPSEIVSNSANMHMIPADDAIESQLESIRPGEIVDLEGYLVRADAEDGWRWVSSLTRNDLGAGACELVWVQNVHRE